MSTENAMSLDQAVEAFMAPEEPAQDSDNLEEVAESLIEEPEEAEEDTEVDETEVDADEESEDTDEEFDESEDEPDQVEPETITVKVDGEEVSVTLEDLKRSYSGQGKIQKGMQEAAQARKEAEAYRAQAMQAAQAMMQSFQQVQQQGAIAEPKPPSKELLENDPIGYMSAQAQYQEDMAVYQQQQQQREYAMRVQAQEAQRMQAETLQREMEMLKKAVPEFANPETGAKLRDDLVAYGQQNGFTVEELSSVADHRALSLLVKAMKYDRLQSSKTSVEAKARKAKPVVKAGAKKVADPKGVARRKQQSKLKKSGSVDDAIGLLFS